MTWINIYIDIYWTELQPTNLFLQNANAEFHQFYQTLLKCQDLFILSSKSLFL